MKHTFWLFRRSAGGLSPARKGPFWLWNVLLVLVSGVCLGLLSMGFAYGDYTDAIFNSYFQQPLLVVLNVAPVVVLVALLWLLLGRAWLAFLLGSLLVWGLSLGNYFMLRFRDDPLMFQDLVNIREAGAITVNADYDLTPDARIIFGFLCILAGTVILLRLARGVPARKLRLVLFLVLAVACVPAGRVYARDALYDLETQNISCINRWSSTQQYISRGFVYPFLHSITAGKLAPPEGYDEEKAGELLAAYTDQDIPEDRQTDLISIQLEAFADLSVIPGIEGVDWEKAYGVYHGIEAESISGNFITNIFAGGTVDSERAFLTGYARQWNFRTDTNSYGWYLRDQGYTVEGAHPSYDWFYNRKNVNAYLGVPQYYFYENYFKVIADTPTAPDSVLMPELLRLYREHREEDRPYFSFNVTYQGHGPYETDSCWRGQHYTDGRYSQETTNILDNYLASLEDTARQLRWLMDELAGEERPVVLVAWGDHKPWLGDGNSVYQELGIDLDTSTEEGFYNYYGTHYFIWANDAAKAKLGRDFVGEGPDLSSCFLMNEVFSLCGWKGDAWMQATEDVRRVIPVLTNVGGFKEGDTFTRTLSEGAEQVYQDYLAMAYYHGSHFCYEDVQ